MPVKDDKTPKAGFYRRGFRAGELADLQTAMDASLREEIAMLRVAIRRLFEMSGQVEDTNEAARQLSALSLSVSRLAGLLQTQAQLGRKAEQVVEAVQSAILQTLEEMGMKP